MNKDKSKNYIAFTIMEMTLVLLITSIIAAASTPIITSAVSDYSNKNIVPSELEAADAPWRKASGYDGGGIYNSPIDKNSPIGIGVRFGNNPSSYRNPALLVASRSSNNIFYAPQIKIIPSAGSYHTDIAMDAFENLSVTSGSFDTLKTSAAATAYIGSKNVFMGSGLQSYANSLSDCYFDKSVILGHKISIRKLQNSINLGYANNRGVHERNNVVIGQNLGAYATDITQQDNIQIGNYSWFNYGVSSISIGNYAANHSAEFRDISIGNYAGYNHYLGVFFAGHTSYMRLYKGDNIIIGKYAGAVYYSPNTVSLPTSSFVSSKYNNVMIGGYAGYSYVAKSNISGIPFSNSVNIGEKAGAVILPNKMMDNGSGENINIGNFSGTYGSLNVALGYYAANNNDIGLNNGVVIGSYAGYNGDFGRDSIIIGSSRNSVHSTAMSAYAATIDSAPVPAIIMGTYAGWYSKVNSGSVFIGSYAGYASGTAGKMYGNVGIGDNACRNVKGSNKWCLGWGISAPTSSLTSSGVSVWNTSNDVPQMFIGYSANTGNSQFYSKTAITLYANDVYRPNSTQFNVFSYSDRRLKTNITPVGDSLAKLRKVNIYDYTLKDDEHKIPQIGVVAQEFKKIFPSEVKKEPNSKKLAVGSDWLIYTMINAIKEVDKNIQDVQAKFENYVKDYMGLKSKVVQLENQAEQIRRENAQIKVRLSKINEKLK